MLVDQVMQSADEAVFSLQFNTRDAVKYVMRNAGVDREVAQEAIQTVVTFHHHD
jgi:hypothetical protein